MARPLPRGDSHLDAIDGVMPYTSFSVGPHGVYWQLCYCGHEFQHGEQMFWVPEADAWVCLRCASRAFYGEDIRRPMVILEPGTPGGNPHTCKRVPQWWAEEHNLDWYGKDGKLPDHVQARIDAFYEEMQKPMPVKEKVVLDDEARKRRERIMSQPMPTVIGKKGLF